MFSNIRWRIALWFIGLSTAAYIVPTVLATILFYANLTATLDGELRVIMASFGHAITAVNGKPQLRDWARTVQTVPPHSLVSYQLFDRSGKLLEESGEPGIPILFKKEHEVVRNGLSMRTCLTSLKEGDTTIGYLQIQLPTKPRDDAMRELAFVTIIFAPLVLLGLGWSSYLVSEKATVSIKKTNMVLRRFLADASHELYTPLSIVQAAVESLMRAVQPTGAGQNEFEIAESALGRMEKTIEDLRMLSAAEDPTPVRKAEVVMLRGLLEDVVSEFQPKFVRKNVALHLESGPDGQLQGERHALHRMFANVVENALRYTDSGGSVTIDLNKESHSIKIADTGIGIPDESVQHIFERFYRVDSSRSRSSGGSGLGLSIAQAIAQAHGGVIEVESALGKGSVFRITLPIAN